MGAVDARRQFVQEVGAKGVDVGQGRASRRNMVAVRELAPAVALGSQYGAIAGLVLIILNQATVHDVFRGCVVVHAENLVLARLRVRELEDRIVTARTGWIGRVWQREAVQHRKTDGADAAGRHLVARKAAGAASSRAGSARVGVANQDRCAVLVD